MQKNILIKWKIRTRHKRNTGKEKTILGRSFQVNIFSEDVNFEQFNNHDIVLIAGGLEHLQRMLDTVLKVSEENCSL